MPYMGRAAEAGRRLWWQQEAVEPKRDNTILRSSQGKTNRLAAADKVNMATPEGSRGGKEQRGF